jgi:hypothetical protein
MKLLTMPELAQSLGISEWMVRMMKRAGFAMPARRSTKEWALDWLKEHPSFCPSDYQRAGSLPNALRQEQTGEDKRHAPSPKRAQRKPSFGPVKRRSVRDVLQQLP